MGHNYLDCISQGELDRLGAQHRAWTPETHSILQNSGFKDANRIVEFGCGPGFTIYDLAKIINPRANITGIDVSDYYLNHLRKVVSEEALENVSVLNHDLGTPLELPIQFDAAFCRWFLAWVTKDLNQVLKTIFDSLRPGGVFVAMEYLTLKSTIYSPPCPSLPRYLDAWEEFYLDAGGTTGVGAILPQAFSETGFRIQNMCCVGGFSKNKDRLYSWWQRLFNDFKEKFREKKLLSDQEINDLENFWVNNEGNTEAFIYSPILLQIVAIKP